MAKQKTEKRKLAELVARQRGIKVKSAQSWLNRVASGKVKKPKYDLTSYAKKKVRKFIRSEKAKREIKPKVPTVPTRRISLDFGGSELLTMQARVRLGSGKSPDIRDRAVNVELPSRTINRILNAPDAAAAAQIFRDAVSYVDDVLDFSFFRFRGREYGPEFFD